MGQVLDIPGMAQRAVEADIQGPGISRIWGTGVMTPGGHPEGSKMGHFEGPKMGHFGVHFGGRIWGHKMAKIGVPILRGRSL